MADEELKQAIQLIKSGDKEAGKAILIRLVKNEPYNEDGWLWLASLTDGEQRKYCLQKALSINPANEKARAYLNQLQPQPSLHERTLEKESKPRVERDSFSTAAAAGSSNEEPYLRPDGLMVFKPSWDKVLLTHTLPYTALLLAITFFALYDAGGPVDAELLLVMMAIMLFVGGFGFLVRMSGLYHVRLSESSIRGPMLVRYPWVRRELKIQEIDLNKTDSKFGFLGYYMLRNQKGAGIHLVGFDKETMLDMVEIIKKQQG